VNSTITIVGKKQKRDDFDVERQELKNDSYELKKKV